ncbi:hypothetical protein C8Q76DRAFT_482929 [Earliella scabrosa]|nr:hypothetical protein C8Q76DRAFT_482929 [Earliella scabrosa]
MRSPLACLPPDLIAHIVSFYKGIRESPEFQGPRRNDRRTLLALTRTCRSLSEAALNRLWADLPSLAPLVYLLPDDAWKLDEHAGSEYTPRVLVSIMVVVFYSCMTISRGSYDLYHQPITLGFTPAAFVGVYCPRLWGIEVDACLLPALVSCSPAFLPNLRSLSPQ